MPTRSISCCALLALPLALLALPLALLLAPLPAHAQTRKGSIGGADKARPTLPVVLERVRAGGKPLAAGRTTDLAFLPMEGPQVLVTTRHKKGQLLMWNLETGERAVLLTVPNFATAGMEQGIVAFTFHPNFPEDRRVYTTFDAKGPPAGQAAIVEWTVQGAGFPDLTAVNPRELLRLPQPEGGHNAGQVRFGPDGMLYQSFGDGGFQRDPDRRGQDLSQLYSSIVRIDVDGRSEGLPYGIPADNPFVGRDGVRPEIWAHGFRNPWRFTFTDDGRLIEADVGQEKNEEINLVVPGGDYGWSFREGAECFAVTAARKKECEAACADKELTLLDPIHHYGHGEGTSIIGGVIPHGSAAPGLAGRFVFGDYASLKLWALELPAPGAQPHVGCSDTPPPALTVHALGKFGLAFISFGLTPEGDVLAGTMGGSVWKLVQAGAQVAASP